MGKKEIDSRFNKFGTVTFTSTSKINDFIDYLEDGKVMGTKCSTCGISYFPPRSDCHKCLSGNLDWFQVDGIGSLVTFSKMKYGPIGFEDDLPYTIALVNFGDFSVFGRMAGDVSDEEIKIGMNVNVKANTLPNGQLNYVFDKA